MEGYPAKARSLAWLSTELTYVNVQVLYDQLGNISGFLREPEVEGSNPFGPTNFLLTCLEMEDIILSNGVKIPSIGLGTWQLLGKECEYAVKNALELGYRHIDTAEIYNNESDIGNAIRGFDRKKLFITSKVWPMHCNYDGVLNACNNSIKRLGCDYLDLYLIHWPKGVKDLEETFRAFKKLYDDGKVKSIGVSNFYIDELKKSLEICDKLNLPLSVNQIEMHPYAYDKKILDFCKENKIVVTSYSPLARGLVIRDKIIKNIAEKCNRTPSQVTLRWLLQKRTIVIPKASSEKHLYENLRIFDFKLSEEDIRKIDLIGRKNKLILFSLKMKHVLKHIIKMARGGLIWDYIKTKIL